MIDLHCPECDYTESSLAIMQMKIDPLCPRCGKHPLSAFKEKKEEMKFDIRKILKLEQTIKEIKRKVLKHTNKLFKEGQYVWCVEDIPNSDILLTGSIYRIASISSNLATLVQRKEVCHVSIPLLYSHFTTIKEASLIKGHLMATADLLGYTDDNFRPLFPNKPISCPRGGYQYLPYIDSLYLNGKIVYRQGTWAVQGKFQGTDEIKRFLKENPGGIFYTNRQVGKTQALLELLHEAAPLPLRYLLTFNHASRDDLRRRYRDQFSDGREKFIRATNEAPGSEPYNLCNSYIDEMSHHSKCCFKPGTFLGAVDTSIVPVKVQAFDNGMSDDILKYGSEDQIKLEHTLEF